MSEDFVGEPVNKFKGKMGICPKSGVRRPLQDIMSESGEWEEKLKRDYVREVGEEPTQEDLDTLLAPKVIEEKVIDPNEVPLEDMTLEGLKVLAAEKGIKVHHKLKDKEKLIALINKGSSKSKL